MVNLEVSTPTFAVFTFVGVHSSQKFASRCVLELQWVVIHFFIVDGFSFHIFQSEELEFPVLTVFTLFSDRHITSTVEHVRNLLHRRFIFIPH